MRAEFFYNHMYMTTFSGGQPLADDRGHVRLQWYRVVFHRVLRGRRYFVGIRLVDWYVTDSCDVKISLFSTAPVFRKTL